MASSDYLMGNDLRLTALPSSGESGLPSFMNTAIGPIPLQPPVNTKVTSTPSNGLWDTLGAAVSTGIQGAAAVGSALWNDWLIGKVDGQKNTLKNSAVATPNTSGTVPNTSSSGGVTDWLKQPKNLMIAGGSLLAVIAGFALIRKF